MLFLMQGHQNFIIALDIKCSCQKTTMQVYPSLSITHFLFACSRCDPCNQQITLLSPLDRISSLSLYPSLSHYENGNPSYLLYNLIVQLICIFSVSMRSKITPTKLKFEDFSRSRAIARSPVKPTTLSKRDQPQFQPGIYISSKFNEEDVIGIKEAFDTYDYNKEGLLRPNDLKVALFHLGFQASKDTTYNIIGEYDEECLGGLNFEAFMRIIASEPVQTQPLSQLRKVFRKMDRDNKGYLDRRDFEILLKNLGEQWSQQQIDTVLQKVDKKEGSRISFDAFCMIMHHPSSLY